MPAPHTCTPTRSNKAVKMNASDDEIGFQRSEEWKGRTGQPYLGLNQRLHRPP